MVVKPLFAAVLAVLLPAQTFAQAVRSAPSRALPAAPAPPAMGLDLPGLDLNLDLAAKLDLQAGLDLDIVPGLALERAELRPGAISLAPIARYAKTLRVPEKNVASWSRRTFDGIWGQSLNPEVQPVFAKGAENFGIQGLSLIPNKMGFPIDKGTVKDLDLFTSGVGLYDIINKTRSHYGSERLQELLRNSPTELAEIEKRQAAVRELMRDDILREKVKAAYDAHGTQLTKETAWYLENNAIDFPIMMIGNVFGLILPAMLLLEPKTVLQMGMMMIYLYAMVAQRFTGARKAYLRFKAAFQLARELAPELKKADSEALRELGVAFSAVDDKTHPGSLTSTAGSLKRLQRPLLMMVLDFILYWSAKSLWWLGRKIKRDAAKIRTLFAAIGELDAYLTLAQTVEEKPAGYILPTFRAEGPAYLRIEDGSHPMLVSKGKAVPNSVDMAVDLEIEQGKTNFLVMTGSNMGGKSTFLKMVSQLILLAQIGAPVPAKAMELTPLKVVTAIDISDSLAEGKSLYDAETDRVLELIKTAETGTHHLIIMDEILTGTNPEEGGAAVHEIIRYLAATPNLFMLATHDLRTPELEGKVPGVGNAHVEESFDGDRMWFTYRVKPGPSMSRNGIAVLEMKGYPKQITVGARGRVSGK